MSNVARYRELCEREDSIPLFCRAHWLDAVCDDWDVVLVEREQRIVAALPYAVKTRVRGMFRMIDMPPLTQYMGPWLSYPANQKQHARLAYEKEIFDELIAGLPPFDHFVQRFHYSIENWLPFSWRGFEETTRYTYVIDDLSDLGAVHAAFNSNIRRNIQKAQKRVRITRSDDIQRFHRTNALTFERQGQRIPYGVDLVQRIDRACSARNSRAILFAEDDTATHAALYLVWDAHSAYYLMGGADPSLRASGAGSLLVWEAIQLAAAVTKRFDFEGSMMEPIEQFFRSFGASQKRLFQISKTPSRILRARHLASQLR